MSKRVFGQKNGAKREHKDEYEDGREDKSAAGSCGRPQLDTVERARSHIWVALVTRIRRARSSCKFVRVCVCVRLCARLTLRAAEVGLTIEIFGVTDGPQVLLNAARLVELFPARAPREQAE